jgi:hypothetical protein
MMYLLCNYQGDVMYNEHATDIPATIKAITSAFTLTWLPYTDVTTTTTTTADDHSAIHQVCVSVKYWSFCVCVIWFLSEQKSHRQSSTFYIDVLLCIPTNY